MKHLFLFFVSLFAITATAQTTVEEWTEAVNKFGKYIPQEKVFVHTDNTCYFLGDTIFYRAYLTRSDNNKPSLLSGVLYVELLNADGYLMERQQVEMKNGMGTGSLVLDTVRCRYAGYYELRAYTRWMLNWGMTTFDHSTWSERWFFNKEMARNYYRDYEKLYSRVFPVYDFPMSPGDYTRDMTERPLQRYYKDDDASPRPSVTLYPEGGNLLAGTKGRVAFDALNAEGRHMRGSLRITDSDGSLVAEASTVNRGRGVVEFTPQAGTKYHCTFQAGENTYKVKMPQLAECGVTLVADVTDDELKVKAMPVGVQPGEVLGLSIMCGGVVVRTINLTTEGTEHAIPLDELPTGVLDITVFNTEGRVYADRLVFNSGKPGAFEANTISITGASKLAGAYEPVTLTLSSGTAKGGIVSLAVMDAASADNIYDNGTLLTEMLLSSEIRGFVEDPGYYFEARDEEHRKALDLLMMVQGWRRYDWRTMAAPKQSDFLIRHPYEKKTPIMSGMVHKYKAEYQADVFRDFSNADVDEYMRDRDTDPWADEQQQETATEEGADVMAQIRQDMSNGAAQYEQYAEKADERFDKKYSSLKREVLVHAEFSQPGSESLVGDMATERGRFKIEAPMFDGEAYFFLAASDSTKWGKKGHNWVQVNHDIVDKRDFPEFYVYLEQPYPRFTHPYTFYQTAASEGRVAANVTVPGLFDDHQLQQVTVRVKRNGKRAFNSKYPAIVVDALEAFNYTIDAGLCTGQFIGYNRFCNDIARAYIGDMGMERQYIMQIRLDDKNSSANMSDGERNSFNDIARLDKVKIYTDFAPRRMGDSRWRGSDQPTVIVDLMRMPNDTHRVTYRDRRMILPGFSVCEEFYNPDYSRQALPGRPDMRRTLYWNPKLILDSEGKAQVTFYRNSRPGQIIVTANGFAFDGSLLSGEAH